MNFRKIACLDVYYYEEYAKSCGIVFETVPTERVLTEYCLIIKSFDDYISGEFYKRELPCLLMVYESIKGDIDLIIVDGFVELDNSKKGLGAHMYEALDGRLPVIGVAKSFFRGSSNYVKLYRGQSKSPLYITSMGIDLNEAARLIRDLNGKFRIPDILKKVDHLSRSDISPG